ncbi:MAG TPA: hypothetical protein VM901_04120 [Bdellovibrionota bacterium]|nr:hypothetical protein [Bdellovibrionota bacterium]
MNLKKFLSFIFVMSLGSALSARADDFVDESKQEALKHHKDIIDPNKFDKISEEVMEKVREEFDRDHPRGAIINKIIENKAESSEEFVAKLLFIEKNSHLLEGADLLAIDKSHFTAVLANYNNALAKVKANKKLKPEEIQKELFKIMAANFSEKAGNQINYNDNMAPADKQQQDFNDLVSVLQGIVEQNAIPKDQE